jgi:hypothetical protein
MPLRVAYIHTKTASDSPLTRLAGAFANSVASVLKFHAAPRSDKNEYFKNPVSRIEVPDYYEKIKKPMCWSVIEGKLERYEYWDLQTFKVRPNLMRIMNCVD